MDHATNNAGWGAVQDGIDQLTRFFTQTMAAFALAALTLPGSAAAQDTTQATETVKATHGAWDIVCATAQADLCVMRQFGKTADGKKVLIIRIRKLDGVKTQDGKTIPAAIQITTPLGTILRAGVKVQVDAGEPRTGAFEVCVPNGCILRDPMTEEFLASLKAGKAVAMTFNVLQQGTLSVSISLKGFTKAFGKL
jgi:invasion protein IalB